MVDIPAVITLAKDAASIVFYAVAATVAIVGLRSWRREHLGKAHYDIAKPILTLVYKIRERVNEQRSRFSMESVWPQMEDVADPQQRNLQAIRINHGRVQAEVYALFSELQPLLLEADVVIGNHKIRESAKAIEGCYSGLHSAVEDYIGSLYATNADRDSLRALKRIVYRKGNPLGQDKFENDFQATIKAAEDILSPFLRK